MSDDQPKVSNADADIEMDIATNTQMTSDNLRKMGYEGAADALHDAAHEAATKAVQDGYVDRPPEEVPLLPGQERIGHGDPQPATTMGEPSGPGPFRHVEIGADGEMPHAEYGGPKPGEVDPNTGEPVPYPVPWNPGVDPAAE
jgi:hypothetical protein